MSESDGSPSPQESQDAPHGSTSDPMRSTEDISKRADIRAARVETRLRRWALIGFIVAAALFWLATLFFRSITYKRGGAVSLGCVPPRFFAFTRSGAPRLVLRAGAAESARIRS